MRRLIVGLLVCLSGAVLAGEREFIWPKEKMPDRQPHQIAAMTDEKEKGTEPYLEWEAAPADDKKTGVCLILISGGGYYNQCDVGLVAEWRKRCAELGIQAVNFVHRTPRPEGLPIYQSAWEDGQRAVRVVRSQAAKRGYDPEKIGTVSMSAGSHLATLLATSSQTPAYAPVDALDETPCHINFALTHAIAYALTDGIGTPNKTGGNGPDVKLDDCFKFDAKTAPMCMTHGGKDAYSPIASTFVYRKLRAMKVPAELHLYADRPHSANGLERQIEFLRQLQILGPLAPEEELLKRCASDEARASYEKQAVWPEGKMPDAQDHQCTPYIEWHQPKTLKTKAIQIIYSGGAYMGNGPESFEVAPFRRYLNEKGVTVVTMKYRTPRPKGLAKHVTAWQDLQRAIRLVRSQAAARGLDPNRIGIMGSSAGGHLTLMGVTSSLTPAYAPIDELDTLSCSVQWAVAIYPAYSLTDGAEHPNATGGNDDSAVLVPEFAFDKGVCPVVFIHGDADGWAAMNSVKCWEKLRRMGVQCDLHTLALRDHCFHRKASPGTGSYTWMDRAWDFLMKKGFVK